MCLLKEDLFKAFHKEDTSFMSITHSSVEVQTSPQEVPSLPDWFGEVTLIAKYLTNLGVLQGISEQVRQDGRRMGHYQVIDFVALLLGYAVSGEPTLQAFFERLEPLATAFMALFGRERLPARSTLSRFLSTLSEEAVEHLRSLFQQDLLARALPGSQEGGLWDRTGRQWHLFDLDGTRATARQRALPKGADLPQQKRRFQEVCAPGYAGRKRGEVVRTRSVLQLASSHQWLASFAGAGNGDYREELKRGLAVICAFLDSQHLALSQALLRLDGLYGSGSLVAELICAGVGFLLRGKDYGLLHLPEVQQRLLLPPDEQTTHPETGTFRQLFDFPSLSLTECGPCCRVIVAAHPASDRGASVGKTLSGMVYELFFTNLPQQGFVPSDVLTCYFGRGGFETTLGDEDREQDADRWCSHRPNGQTCWQILAQWVWNLRLELGQQLHSPPLRTTQLAPALTEQTLLTPPPLVLASAGQDPPTSAPAQPEDADRRVVAHPRFRLAGYEPPLFARQHAGHMYAAQDFVPQGDGTLQCPNQQPLRVRARYPQNNGDLHVFYAASPKSCLACPLRTSCLRAGQEALSPRQVSLRYHRRDDPSQPPPAASVAFPKGAVGSLPLLWKDGPRCETRRHWIRLLRSQTVTITALARPSAPAARLETSEHVLSLARRKHWRLSWAERLARNATPTDGPFVHLHLFGIPENVATLVGVASSL
jgi:hypothetical protein